MWRPAKTTTGSAARGSRAAAGDLLQAGEHLDVAVDPLGPQPLGRHPRERERVLRHTQAQLLHRPADAAARCAEVVAPVGPRPQLKPVDDEPVAAQRAHERGRKQREERKRRGVDDVIAAPVTQQMPQHAGAEDERGPDPPPAVDVERHARARRADVHARQLRPRPALPLAQREVRDVVPVGDESLCEGAIPPLAAADRVRKQAVVDDQDPHPPASVADGGDPLGCPARAQHSRRACVCNSEGRSAPRSDTDHGLDPQLTGRARRSRGDGRRRRGLRGHPLPQRGGEHRGVRASLAGRAGRGRHRR